MAALILLGMVMHRWRVLVMVLLWLLVLDGLRLFVLEVSLLLVRGLSMLELLRLRLCNVPLARCAGVAAVVAVAVRV